MASSRGTTKTNRQHYFDWEFTRVPDEPDIEVNTRTRYDRNDDRSYEGETTITSKYDLSPSEKGNKGCSEASSVNNTTLSASSSPPPAGGSLVQTNTTPSDNEWLVTTVKELQRKLVEESQKHQSEVKELQTRLGEVERRACIDAKLSLMPWRSIETGSPDNKAKNDLAFQLPEDVYSILACWNWKTKPFCFSLLVIFGLQLILLILLVLDRTHINHEYPLDLPVNVETKVRFAQCLAIIVAVYSQDDLRMGIEGISQGLPTSFKGSDCLLRMTRLQWNLAYMVRFVQGSMNLFASFLLLMQSDNVFDLLLNFLGVAFISDLDDMFFRLGGLGYFGSTTNESVVAISGSMFYREDKHQNAKKCSPSWCRKHAHVLGVFGVLAALLVGIFSILILQKEGAYSVQSFFMEFGDETVPSLGLFNGCYEADNTGETASGRMIYSRVGSGTSGGAFAFCNEMQRWTFYDKAAGGSECKDYIIKSEETRTFDILEVGNVQWYTDEGLPLEFLKVSQDQCADRRHHDENTCAELELDATRAGSRFRSYYEKLQVGSLDDTDRQDATLSHAIYLDKANLEVVLFTGRRWVMTNADKLSKSTNSNLTDIAAIQNFFYAIKKFVVKEQVQNWISFVSEEVDSFNDQGTPLGLRFYYPRYEKNNRYNFPSTDLSRPYDAIFSCALCDDVLNPCYFGGTCHMNGTCACANGASGQLCQEKPLGDSVCNPYFNNAGDNFDGGDCCGATCSGGLCGAKSNSFPFGLDNVRVEPVVGEDDGFFDYDQEMGIVATSDNVIRYDCQEPEMATFTIEISTLTRDTPDDRIPKRGIKAACAFGSLSVRCDGRLYLQTPPLLFPDEDHCSQSFLERVLVPHGVQCELVLVDPWYINWYRYSYKIGLLYDDGSNSTLIQPRQIMDGSGGEVTWAVPLSQCLTEVLSDATLSIFNISSTPGRAIQSLSEDGLSEYQCSRDVDMLRERFFLTLLDQSVNFTSQMARDLHQCRGWGLPSVRIQCNGDDKITSLSVAQGVVEAVGGITLPTEISFLSHLETLRLHSISMTGLIPSELFSLRNLTAIDLDKNAFTGPVPTEIGYLQNLIELRLFDNALNGSIPSELGSLEALTHLELRDNALVGSIPSELGNIMALTDLNLCCNALTGSIPSELRNLKNLTRLWLPQNGLNGTIPSDLGSLQTLTSLGLFYNDLGGSIPSELGNIMALTYLSLFKNDLSGSIPSGLGKLEALTSLLLSSNDLNGSIPSELGQLLNLTELVLDNNALTGSVASELGGLHNLTILQLENNRLTGTIPEGLIALTSMDVHLGGNSNLTMTGNSLSGRAISSPKTLLTGTIAENQNDKPCCPSGYSGMLALDNCIKFYLCHHGEAVSTPVECPVGTLFDNKMQHCNFAMKVSCAGNVICP